MPLLPASLKYLVTASLLLPSMGDAAVTWYFNWYCANCSKIGARTTGTEGPFPSESACENARSSMRSMMGSRGGGVDTMPCSSQGVPETARTEGSSAAKVQPTPQMPAYDYEAGRLARERRATEERDRATEAKRQAEEVRQNAFARDRSEAVGSLKGGAVIPFAIKGNPEGDLHLKAAPPQAARNLATGWEQLHCAAALSLDAISAAERQSPDSDEVRYLADEALKALNGDPIGVLCPDAPPPPVTYDANRMQKSRLDNYFGALTRDVVARADTIAEASKNIGRLQARRSAATDELAVLRESPLLDAIGSGEADDAATDPLAWPVKVVGDSANRRMMLVPLPPTMKIDTSLWRINTRFIPFSSTSLQKQRSRAATHSEDELRLFGIRRAAVEAATAHSEIDVQRRARMLNDFWFDASMRAARDKLLREERGPEAWNEVLEKMEAEIRRRNQRIGNLERLRAEGERQLDLARESILDAKQRANNNAITRAVHAVKNEILAMMEQGLVRQGDNLVDKDRNDPIYHQALDAAVARSMRQLAIDREAAAMDAVKALAAEANRLTALGLLPEIPVDDERELDTIARRLLDGYDSRMAAARQNTERALAQEFQRLKRLAPQKLREAERAVREIDAIIQKAQRREHEARNQLKTHRQAITAAMANPEPTRFDLTGTK